jgi:1,4-alpha-glucan branching enzyme
MPQPRTRNRQAAPKRAKTTSPEAPNPLAVTPVRVKFQVYEPHARHVTLAGEFNQWNPDAAPMQPHDDGHWFITLDLLPRRYQYKFVVDGQWLPDIAAHENVPNEHGTLNSVIEVHNPSQST